MRGPAHEGNRPDHPPWKAGATTDRRLVRWWPRAKSPGAAKPDSRRGACWGGCIHHAPGLPTPRPGDAPLAGFALMRGMCAECTKGTSRCFRLPYGGWWIPLPVRSRTGAAIMASITTDTPVRRLKISWNLPRARFGVNSATPQPVSPDGARQQGRISSPHQAEFMASSFQRAKFSVRLTARPPLYRLLAKRFPNDCI